MRDVWRDDYKRRGGRDWKNNREVEENNRFSEIGGRRINVMVWIGGVKKRIKKGGNEGKVERRGEYERRRGKMYGNEINKKECIYRKGDDDRKNLRKDWR